VGGRETRVKGSTSSATKDSEIIFLQPGSSKLKCILKSKELAFSYARLCLAVAFTEGEYRKFRKLVYLYPADKSVQRIEGLTWYLFNVRKGKIPLAFGFWCLRHWKRCLGLDPRSPSEIVNYPTLDFLTNYSSSSRLSRAGTISSEGFPKKIQEPMPDFDEVRHSLDFLERDLPSGSRMERLSALLSNLFEE